MLLLAALLAGCTEAPQAGGADDGGNSRERSTLAQVEQRGNLICGVNDQVPGFGFVNDQGEYEGFDVDFCKAVAAAVLGDPERVEYKPLTAQNRITALQSGEIDMLSRNTTATVSRDVDEGVRFVTTTYYDGARIMVKAEKGYRSLQDMDGTTICVLSGTTTEQVLATRAQQAGIEYTPDSYDDNEKIQPVFERDGCEGWLTDESQAAGVRANWPESQGGPEALRIFGGEPLSKEPLGPVVRDGDDQWASVVDWTVQATMLAEELGVNSENVRQIVEDGSDDVDVQRLLGLEVEGEDGAQVFDPGLGLEPGFVTDVISAVGNYGEIFERNVGPDSRLQLERELNALWTDGGLHYPRPYS